VERGETTRRCPSVVSLRLKLKPLIDIVNEPFGPAIVRYEVETETEIFEGIRREFIFD